MRGEASRPGKRPARNLSAAEKLEIIQRVHDGESKASVARNIGVPESTLRGWCKTELKLRSMTRNSSTTPDSEAHSSSGSNPVAGPSHLSSDEELDVGVTAAKRRKTDDTDAATAASAALKQQSNYDYAAHFLSSMMASGVRGTERADFMLMQQMGLLPSVSSNLAQLIGLPAFQALTGATSTSSQSVGLVENGLQYSKNSAGSNSKRHSSAHTSSSSTIVAPSRNDAVPKRNSLPAAAEAPITVTPISPRKTSEHSLSNGALQKHAQLSITKSSSSKRDSGVNGSQQDVLRWLEDQQHQIGGGESTSSASAATPASSEAQTSKSSAFYNMYMRDVMSTSTRVSTSPKKAKAILDNVLLGNNNNENVPVSSNLPASPDSGDCKALELRKTTTISTEEAVECGEKLYKWLENCGNPNITGLHVMNLKQILQNIKTPASQQNKSSRSKHSRK